MWQWIKKKLALWSYQAKLGPLLVDRYGRQPRYTPPQVLTTIKTHGLSETYAAYACAMYCSKQAYSAFATARTNPARPVDGTRFDPAWLLWSAASAPLWPEHDDIVAELGHSHAGHADADHAQPWSDAGTDFDGHFGHEGFDGAGSDHGGHDGGAGGDGGSD